MSSEIFFARLLHQWSHTSFYLVDTEIACHNNGIYSNMYGWFQGTFDYRYYKCHENIYLCNGTCLFLYISTRIDWYILEYVYIIFSENYQVIISSANEYECFPVT